MTSRLLEQQVALVLANLQRPVDDLSIHRLRSGACLPSAVETGVRALEVRGL